MAGFERLRPLQPRFWGRDYMNGLRSDKAFLRNFIDPGKQASIRFNCSKHKAFPTRVPCSQPDIHPIPDKVSQQWASKSTLTPWESFLPLYNFMHIIT